MLTQSVSFYGRICLIALVGFNVAFAAFFVLWSIADNSAINGMEAVSGYDPVSMLPNANLLWSAAYASLVLLVIVDVCAVAMSLKFRKTDENAEQPPVSKRTPSF